MSSWTLCTAIAVSWSPKLNSNPEWCCAETIIIKPLFFTPDQLLFKGHLGVVHTVVKGENGRHESGYDKKEAFSSYLWGQCTRPLKL